MDTEKNKLKVCQLNGRKKINYFIVAFITINLYNYFYVNIIPLFLI